MRDTVEGGATPAGWGKVRDWPLVAANMRPDLDARLRRLKRTHGISVQHAIRLCVEAGLSLLERQDAAPVRPGVRGRRRAETGPERTVKGA